MVGEFRKLGADGPVQRSVRLRDGVGGDPVGQVLTTRAFPPGSQIRTRPRSRRLEARMDRDRCFVRRNWRRWFRNNDERVPRFRTHPIRFRNRFPVDRKRVDGERHRFRRLRLAETDPVGLELLGLLLAAPDSATLLEISSTKLNSTYVTTLNLLVGH